MHSLISLVLAIFLGACSASESESNVFEADSIVADVEVAVDESKFLHDKVFRESMLQSCLQSKAFRANTAAMGEWYDLKNCNIEFNGIRIDEKDLFLHLDKKGNVNAFGMMILPSTEYGKYLLRKYNKYSVNKDAKICIKYYSNTLPLLQVVSDSLCDALAYVNCDFYFQGSTLISA